MTKQSRNRTEWKKWFDARVERVRSATSNIPRAFGLVWDAHKPSALAMLACTLVGAFLPASQAWVAKLIVDAVVNAINTHADAQTGISALAPLLVAGFVLVVVQTVNNQARVLAEHVLHARMNLAINTRIIRKALELDLTHF